MKHQNKKKVITRYRFCILLFRNIFPRNQNSNTMYWTGRTFSYLLKLDIWGFVYDFEYRRQRIMLP